jgi:hypothetical protein
MQMVNLGLSIFSKVQTMQHRQIILAKKLSPTRREQQFLSRKQKEEELISVLEDHSKNPQI